MNVRIVPFARIRELVGASSLGRTLPAGARARDAFAALAAEFPALAELGPSTRYVRAAAFIDASAELFEGDELGLLPPYGGG